MTNTKYTELFEKVTASLGEMKYNQSGDIDLEITASIANSVIEMKELYEKDCINNVKSLKDKINLLELQYNELTETLSNTEKDNSVLQSKVVDLTNTEEKYKSLKIEYDKVISSIDNSVNKEVQILLAETGALLTTIKSNQQVLETKINGISDNIVTANNYTSDSLKSIKEYNSIISSVVKKVENSSNLSDSTSTQLSNTKKELNDKINSIEKVVKANSSFLEKIRQGFKSWSS